MTTKDKDAEAPSTTEADGNVVAAVANVAVLVLKKSLDVNKYATKKTIAQGLLDVALLTANASQLKYILQVGEKHEFYALMLSLISISIVLQFIVAILFVIIGGLNINKERDHRAAVVLNDIILIFIFLISVINVIISGFGFEYSSQPLRLVTAGLLSVLVAVLRTYQDDKIDVIVTIFNQISVGFVTGALFCDVIKMNFGLDPALAVGQACLCVLLGSALNINKEEHCTNANKANNIILCVNIVIMAVNVLIGTFEMKDAADVFDWMTNQTTTAAP